MDSFWKKFDSAMRKVEEAVAELPNAINFNDTKVSQKSSGDNSPNYNHVSIQESTTTTSFNGKKRATSVMKQDGVVVKTSIVNGKKTVDIRVDGVKYVPEK